MRIKLIRKIVGITITTITVIGMLSVGASAQWREDNHGWWNQKGNGYSVSWESIGNKWYYFGSDGYMKTGWLDDGGKWYYLNPNGDMAYNVIVDGYKLGPDGAWIEDNSSDVTTGAAVNVTTGAAVTISINTTTSSAVTLPADDNTNYYLNNFNKEQKRAEHFIEYTKYKLDKEAQRAQERMNRIWSYFYR